MDSETSLIKNKYTWPDVVAAGFSSAGEVQIVQWQHLDQYQREFLKLNPENKFVFFNNAFDINVMGRGIWLEELKKENRIMELSVSYKIYLVGTQGWVPMRLTLYDTAKRILGVELNKEDGTRTSFTRDKPLTQQQILYLAEDCIATELCGLAVNNMPTETLQARASFVLSEISHNGMLVDMANFNAMREKQMLEMARLAKVLRSFGFTVKKDTDKLTQLQRISRVCENFGVPDVAKHTEASGKKQFPKAALWILAANLISMLRSADTPVMPSDVEGLIVSVVTPVFDPSVDWSSGNKVVKQLESQALDAVRDFLSTIDCADAVPERKQKADVALTLLEVADEKFHSVGNDVLLDEISSEFKQCYDENLGWLPGTKKPTNSEFIQAHLKQLLANNPELEMPLTDAANDNIREYVEVCRDKGLDPDPQKLKDMAVYACKRQEMWRLSDLNIKDPFLEAYTSFKHAEKLLGTYLNPKYIAEDGRTHSTYGSFLNTGRTSSAAPNAQNLPKEQGLREIYQAPPGHVICSCDYSQEELITLAATQKVWFGRSRMADAINAGLCLHSTFALYRDGKLADIGLDNIADPRFSEIIKERGKPYKDKPLKARRQQAKMANFRNWPASR